MKTAPFARFSVTTLETVADRTIEISLLNANESIVDSPLFTALKAAHAAYKPLIRKQTFSGMGTDIAELDQQRDRSFSSLRRIVTGYSNYDSPKGVAARGLLALFEQVGDISVANYADEDALLDNFKSRLEAPEARKQIETLGLKKEVEDLIDKHHAFKAAYMDQTDANSSLRQQASASSLRKDLENALRDFFFFVTAMRNVPPWSDIYADLTETVKSAKASLRKQAKANEEEQQQE